MERLQGLLLHRLRKACCSQANAKCSLTLHKKIVSLYTQILNKITAINLKISQELYYIYPVMIYFAQFPSEHPQ